MDYPENWPQPSGLTGEGAPSFASAYTFSVSKDDDWWAKAEDQTAELITSIQPIQPSEERRQAVVDFVQRLIKKCSTLRDCQVVAFGSVPLKTYLPDGDIDLTALSFNTELKETWAADVHNILKKEEQNADAEFRVKEVQYIHADVKIIKCLVENIVVDISFNQTGGLCTLCFLEEVDRLIGQKHLFKRSIILVKAWCYYESRILGAHHGLISTFALETLVLYIFHVFHASLRGPLEVLYTFLQYFSNFDWDKYCVTLWGPVPLEVFKDSTAGKQSLRYLISTSEPPRKDGGNLLLTKEFLEECSATYSINPLGQDSNQGRAFQIKFLNVLDPIRETNNLGRSVSKGNFGRIRLAFGYGAKKLKEVLAKDDISAEFKLFFPCTFTSLKRYHSGGRPDTASPSRGSQKASTGGGSVPIKEKVTSGQRQENGEVAWYSGPAETYIAEAARPQFQHGARAAQMYTPRSQSGMDPNRVSYKTGTLNDPTMGIQAPTTMSDTSYSKGSGSTVNAVYSNSDKKQENNTGTDTGTTWSAPGNVNAMGAEMQWTQADVKGGNMNQEGEKVRLPNRGPSYEPSQGGPEKTAAGHRRSSDAHEHAVPKDSMGGEYQATEPSQESARPLSMDDPAGKGVSQIRNAGASNINYTNHYGVGPPGFSGEVPMKLNQGSVNSRISSGDSRDLSTSGRKSDATLVVEEEKTSHSKRIGSQSEPIPSIDSSYQGISQDQVSQSMLHLPHSSTQSPPFMQLPLYGHQGQIHLGVSKAGSSSMSISTLNLAGPPPPPLSLHSTYPSASMGESSLGLGPWTPPFLNIRRGPMPPPLPPYMFPMAHLGDTTGSRMSPFPASHGEEQRDPLLWSPSLEEQTQQQHRPVVSTSASSGGHSLPPLQIPERSFPLGGSQLSAGSPSPFFLQPSMMHQGQIKPVLYGVEHTIETCLDHESVSHSSIDDGRQMDDPSQRQEEAESVGSNLRSRENYQNGAEVKASVGKPLKPAKEKRVSSKAKVGSGDDSMDVVRGGDGNPAESPLQCQGHPTIDELPVMGMQAVPQVAQVAQVAPVSKSVLTHPNLTSTSLPHTQNVSVSSGKSEAPLGIPYQTFQLPPNHRTTVGADSAPSPTTQMMLPTSVGVPIGPSNSLHAPVSDFGSMSVGPSPRNRSMETASMPPTYYPQQFYLPYHSFPTCYFQPPSTDSMATLYSNGLMDSGMDTLSSQVSDDSRGRNIAQVGMGVGERLTAAGIAISSGSKVETTNVDRASESIELNSPPDILIGDLDYHRYHLLRSCNPPMASPMHYPQAKYFQGPQYWEGSGRQNGNIFPYMGMNVLHTFGALAPSLHSPSRMGSGNYPPRGFASYGNEETSPKPRGGTGTYLPNPRHTHYNRERQAPGGGRGGSQHGGYSQQERTERTNDREGANSAHGSRYRGVGPGRGQQSKQEHRGQSPASGIGTVTSDPKSSASDRERNNTRVQQQYVEFGSFGSVPCGAGLGGQMSGGRTSQEQVFVSGPPGSAGLSSPSGERLQQPSSPHQRGMRRAYQMQEEDFPPLLPRSQGATGFATGPNSSTSNAATQGSQYQKPYVNVTLSPPSYIAHRLQFVELMVKRLKCNVFMLSYRGYGDSEGFPSQKGLTLDAQAALDYLWSRPGLDPTRIVVFGRSLGGAVGSALAKNNPDKVAGLILENTFTSVLDMAGVMLPGLRFVVGGKGRLLNWFVKSPWKTIELIKQVHNSARPVFTYSGCRLSPISEVFVVK